MLKNACLIRIHFLAAGPQASQLSIKKTRKTVTLKILRFYFFPASHFIHFLAIFLYSFLVNVNPFENLSYIVNYCKL